MQQPLSLKQKNAEPLFLSLIHIYLLECFGWETWVETMNLYLEADESVLGVIFIVHRLLDEMCIRDRYNTSDCLKDGCCPDW